MCLDLALDAQDQSRDAAKDRRLADEMAARVFALAEVCNCMGWTRSSRLLRMARAELLAESEDEE
jgi:hypothetical protein